ncbi:hypothetical protein K438DRAFT_1183398 [Mycena galopus ATCC 62051]|nr:hypothetical protein K438DRAFT_1183398 [Mycena galopus ATCC 62051]
MIMLIAIAAARMNVPATQSDMSTVPLIPIPALEPWMFEFTRAPAANPALDFSPNFNLDFLMGTPSNEDWTANSIFPALDVPGMIQPTLFGLDKDNFNTLIPHVSNFAVDGLTDAFPELSDTVPSASTSTGQFDAWPWPFLRPHLPDSSPATALAQFSEPGPSEPKSCHPRQGVNEADIANSRGITVPSMRKRHAEEEISEQPLKKGKGRAWN